jgi:hypothetical protein
MSIPQGSLNNNSIPNLGEIVEIKDGERTIGDRVAETDIPFGLGIVQGAAAHQAKIPASAVNKFLGVARSHFGASGIASDKYLAGDQVDFVDNGVISVQVEEAVDQNSAVRVRHTAGAAGTAPGQFCTTADAGKTMLLTGAKFKSSTTGAGRAALDLSGVFTQTADV